MINDEAGLAHDCNHKFFDIIKAILKEVALESLLDIKTTPGVSATDAILGKKSWITNRDFLMWLLIGW